MSDIDLAVTRCKKFEGMLTKYLGASGKGLHEKISSVEPRLPEPLTRKLRKIATIRNKIVHDENYTRIDDRKDFLRTCDDAERELRKLLGLRRIGWKTILAMIVILALALLAMVYFSR